MDTNHPVDSSDRPLPHSLEAEQSVLGAILIDHDAMNHALELRPAVFFSQGHRKVFAAMVELMESDIPIDLTTLVSRLHTKGWLDQAGGVTYLAEMAKAVPTAENIAYYIEIVKGKYRQRQLIEAAKDLSESAFASDDASQTIAEAQTKLDALIDGVSSRKGIRKLRDILIECYEDIEIKYVNRDGTGVTGIPSGFDELDRITGGFQPSDLIIVGARPSVGKTAFALNVARNSAAEVRKTVAVFSLEMSEKQLVNRMISAESHIDASRIRSGHLDGDDWEKLTIAIGILNEYPILIDDTPGITVHEIRAKCRKLKKECDLGMVVIDYLQLIEAVHRSGVNRQQEITEISRSLKKLAKELNVPVIALSQLSRGVEQRQDKRPMMSDLRESGAIEQDADIVAFLYRDDYYDKESEKRNIIEIIVAKQRNGPIGTVELAFMKPYNKFLNLDLAHSATPQPKPEREKNPVPDMYRNGVR